MRIRSFLIVMLLLGSTTVLAENPPKAATAQPLIYDETYLSLWAKRLALMQAARTRPGRFGGKYAPPKTVAGKWVYTEDAKPKR